MRRTSLFAALPIAAVVAVVWACNDVAFTDESCSKGTDCLAPYVCCTKPFIPPAGKEIPYCEKVDECEGYLPFLVEGNPCNRIAAKGNSAGGGVDGCSEGLECCANILTCQRTGSCPTMPPPEPPDGGTNASCNADRDCATGEVCCQISFFQRDGKCASVKACTALVQMTTTR